MGLRRTVACHCVRARGGGLCLQIPLSHGDNPTEPRYDTEIALGPSLALALVFPLAAMWRVGGVAGLPEVSGRSPRELTANVSCLRGGKKARVTHTPTSTGPVVLSIDSPPLKKIFQYFGLLKIIAYLPPSPMFFAHKQRPLD